MCKTTLKRGVALVLLAVLIQAGWFGLVSEVGGGSGEETELRGWSSKVHSVGDGTYRLTSYPKSIHYQDEGGVWQDIDETIQESARPNWDWQVEKGHWTLLIREDTTVALGKDGHWVGFRVDGLAYYDRESKEYVILRSRQAVTPQVSGNSINWTGIFAGVTLRYTYTSDRFGQEIIISQGARGWLTANPPSSYGLSNASSYLAIYSYCDWRNAYPSWDDDNTPINWAYDNDLSRRVVFKSPATGRVISAMTPSYAYSQDDEDEPVKIHKRYWRDGDSNWLVYGAKVSELAALPAGAIVLDPDSTFYPDPHVEVATVDGIVYEETTASWADIEAAAGDTALDDSAMGSIFFRTAGSPNFDRLRRWIGLFDTSGLPDDCTIIATTLSLYGSSKADDAGWAGSLQIVSSNPASDTALVGGDYDCLGITPFSTAISYGDYGLEEYNDYEFNANGIASVSKTGVSKYGGIEGVYDLGAATPDWATAGLDYYMKFYAAEEAGTGKDPKLVVTYSVSEAPTVVTVNATEITHEAATLIGNITDTGGENCDTRGFEWGIATANYTSNWTEVGSFGVGTYNRTVTSLTDNTTYFWRPLAHNSANWGYGVEDDFTTQALPSPLPPSGLTLTDWGLVTVGANWTTGNYSSYTMLRGSRTGYPTTVTAGELIYYGNLTSVNFTSYNLDIIRVRVSAWGYKADNTTSSASYTTAIIGGELLDEIATAVEALATALGTIATSVVGLGLAAFLARVMSAMVVLTLTILAFWHRDPIMYLVAGFALILYSFTWWTTASYLSVLLLLAGLGVFAKAWWGRKARG